MVMQLNGNAPFYEPMAHILVGTPDRQPIVSGMTQNSITL
jgi:hypothetical protein